MAIRSYMDQILPALYQLECMPEIRNGYALEIIVHSSRFVKGIRHYVSEVIFQIRLEDWTRFQVRAI